MAQTPSKSIVLIGMMGAGKTHFGQLLGESLSLPFCDSDAIIEARLKSTISDYFANHGESAFREREYETLSALLDGPVQVISAGGGIVTNPKSRELLKARAHAIWLQADVSELVRRCALSDARPLLKTGDPATILAGLLDKRASMYAEAAAFTVRTDTHTIPETLSMMMDGLKQCQK